MVETTAIGYLIVNRTDYSGGLLSLELINNFGIKTQVEITAFAFFKLLYG